LNRALTEESMTRLSLLLVLSAALPLIGCADAPANSSQSQVEPKTGTLIPGTEPANPVITVGRDQIDQTSQKSIADVLNHSSAWPILQVHGQ
jgi:hypothetical protein